jgi:putative membrane protein
MTIKRTILLAGAAMAIAMSGAQAQQKADKDSQSFIKTAIQHNYAEIDVGKLAQEKGTSADVKAFGARMVKDHGEANEKAIAAAKQIGVDPPTGTDMMHQGTYLKLKVLSGDTFDRSFAKGMVSDHQHDVQEFSKAAKKSDPAGSFAKETLPVLQAHLQEAQKLNASVSQTTGSGSKTK